MLVCLCHSVTEKELTQAVDLGLSTMEEFRRDLLVGASCGSCADFAKRVVTNHLESKALGAAERGGRPHSGCAEIAKEKPHPGGCG